MPDNCLLTEKELVSLLSKGNEKAFLVLYNRFAPRVFNYSLRLTKLKYIAEETVQFVFTRIWEKHSQIDSQSNFEGYLLSITHNHVLNCMRDIARDVKKRAEVFQSITTMRNTTEESVHARELQAFYYEAINKLPQRKREIYTLKKEASLSHSDIGKILSISPLTVKKHMVEAVKFIRNYVSLHSDLGCAIILFSFF